MEFNKDNSFFLIGGHDLEMHEIINIFEANNIKYIDNNLKWGAKLSDYKEELEKYKDKTIYGIELETDVRAEYLSNYNYALIDHHGESSHKKSALEQVAEILEIELNEYQNLIAMNDCGGPKKMLEYLDIPITALNNEKLTTIRSIRELDLTFQGVEAPVSLTKSELSYINKNKYTISNNILVVPSQSGKFGATFDAMYLYHENKEMLLKYEYVIVYSDDEACLYFPKEKRDTIENINVKPPTSFGMYSGGTFLGYYKKEKCTSVIDKAIINLKDIIKNI